MMEKLQSFSDFQRASNLATVGYFLTSVVLLMVALGFSIGAAYRYIHMHPEDDVVSTLPPFAKRRAVELLRSPPLFFSPEMRQEMKAYREKWGY